MLTTGFFAANIALAGTVLSAALPGVPFEIQPFFEPEVHKYEPDARLPSQKRDSGNCGSSTYYNPSVGTGACGWQNSDNDLVVALPPQYFQGQCGQSITITANGKTAIAKVVDLCPSCEGGHIDMSPALFQHFAALEQGRVNTCWTSGSSAAAAPITTISSTPVQQYQEQQTLSSYNSHPEVQPTPEVEVAALSSASHTLLSTSTASPQTLHLTITRTRTTTVPYTTSTTSLGPTNTGAEMYEAAVSNTATSLPTKALVGGLFGAIQNLHGHGPGK